MLAWHEACALTPPQLVALCSFLDVSLLEIRARAVNVGATPGVTTSAQTVSIDSKVKLMDCPGIVFARASNEEEAADVALRNCVRVEKLDDPIVPVEAILRKVSPEQMMEQYGIGAFSGATEFLTLVAARRGHLRKGGGADHEGAARHVLQDWNSGAIRYHTEPPASTAPVEVVAHLASDFDWNAPVKTTMPDAATASSGSRAAAAARRAEGKRVSTVCHAKHVGWCRCWHVWDAASCAVDQCWSTVCVVDSLCVRRARLGRDRKSGSGIAPRCTQVKRSSLLMNAAAARSVVHQRLGDEHDQYNFQPNKAIQKKVHSCAIGHAWTWCSVFSLNRICMPKMNYYHEFSPLFRLQINTTLHSQPHHADPVSQLPLV